MPKDFTISQLNRIVTINQFIYGQNDSGGNIKMLVLSYEMYAGMRLINNSYLLQQLQLKYGEAWEIKLRYEPSRLLTPNDEIVYDNKVHKIQGIVTKEEAAKWFLVINTSTDNSQSSTGSGSVFIPVKEYHWEAIGDDYTVQADEVKAWVGIILLFRDKVQYRVIRTGTPTAHQVLYDQNAGSFTFNNSIIPLATGETVDAYLINA